jgi:hypothetical protein
MPLSCTHKITLWAALIAAAGTIAAALLSNSGNNTSINQNGHNDDLCVNSKCVQG